MSVVHSGDRGVYLSGYNSTIRDLTVEGNGCGGIGMEGGDQVSNTLNSQDCKFTHKTNDFVWLCESFSVGQTLNENSFCFSFCV